MGTGAALEALQKMGMAPSDTEIDEAAKARAPRTLRSADTGDEK